MQLKHHRTNAQNKRETWFGYLNSSYSNHKHYISTCNHLKHNINYKQTTITVTWICVKNKNIKTESSAITVSLLRMRLFYKTVALWLKCLICTFFISFNLKMAKLSQSSLALFSFTFGFQITVLCWFWRSCFWTVTG